MQSRLLIINCPSEHFLHIPMGTFGLCDYLAQKNIDVKLLNLALYNIEEMDNILNKHIELFQPTHIGLIFHWQDTAEGVLWTGEYIKSHFDHIKLICGGFTAGYFGKDLLKKCWFFDYLIKGDPEKPLELLLKGTEPSQIPNIIYRDAERIISNDVSYIIDHETLSSISFCTVTYLYDHELYIKTVEEKLGFPICIGRGCLYNCHYCGGSLGSFKLHSGKNKPVVRSIDAIISDLRRLNDFTKKIYICYEIDRKYIMALFKAMKHEGTLIKTFQLNYGAWQLFDRDFLELYRDIFLIDEKSKPLFELSPEVFDDKSRKKIKHRNVTYTIEDLKQNLHLINDFFHNGINISLFFSRYHDAAKTYPDMMKEISGIFKLKHDMVRNNINADIFYDHLSTDVASNYWEKYVENPHDFDTLVHAARKLKSQEEYSFPVNNLCIYKPGTLSNDEIFRCELMIFILKVLERYFSELFHILYACLKELMINIIEEIIIEEYSKRPGNVFTDMNYSELLNFMKIKIAGRKSFSSKVPFIDDLIGLNIKKAMYQHRSQYMKSSYQTKRPKINNAFISVHDHDYLDLINFLKRLKKEWMHNLTPDRTVFIFLIDEILSMSYETYHVTIKKFEEGITLDEYYELMEERQIFTPSYHRGLIAKLFQSNVLY
ncbi:MAG: hypothetical protein AB1480_15305 [Nitrospirota bacterium]